MGDPKKLRKKYSTPSHPWQKQRIDEERVLMREYGFKNKAELWKLNSKLRKYKTQVKNLISKHDEHAEKQKVELIKRVQKLNLIDEKAVLEDILSLTLKDICERRLQTIVLKKGLARSIKQARQFITHEHIVIGDQKITSPSYIVSSGEEIIVKFADNSEFRSEDHPERLAEKPKVTKKKEPEPVEEEVSEEPIAEKEAPVEEPKEEPVEEEKPAVPEPAEEKKEEEPAAEEKKEEEEPKEEKKVEEEK